MTLIAEDKLKRLRAILAQMEPSTTLTVMDHGTNEGVEVDMAEMVYCCLTARRMKDLLLSIVNSGIEFDDSRIGYVTMQIDREILEEARKVTEENP